MKPRVLILVYSFPPANHVAAMRGVRIGRAFVRQGWEVHILKSSFTHAPQDFLVDTSGFHVHSYDPDRLTRILFEAPPDMSAKRLLLSVARRLIPPDHSWMLRGAILKAVEHLGGFDQFDCVVSSAFPFVLHDVCRARREAGEQFLWVADTRDMWAGSTYRGLQLIPSAYLRTVEAKIFALADIATFASQSTAAIYARRYDIETRVVLNGYEGTPPAETHPRSSRLRRFCHTGSLYGGRRKLKPLADALALASERDGEAREIVLAGADSIYVAGLLRPSSAVPIRALGELPRPEAIRLQNESDCLVLAMDDTDYDATYTPAKLFEYAFTGRPIIAIAREESDVGQLVSRHGLGVASFDPMRIAEFIGRVEAGRWPGPRHLSELTAAAQFDRLVDWVESAARHRVETA